MKNTIALLIVAFAILLAGCPSEPTEQKPPPTAEQKPLVVFLVRHAEKTDDGKDPELSEAGKARTEVLAETLKSSDIEHVHSTDFIRTRDTAAPVAKAEGVEVEKYDPKDLAGFAKKLKETGGRHLVVGHSNTTPELAKLLGGDPGTAIDEKGEYDRLYIVTIGKDGTVNSVLLRYGAAFEKPAESEEKKEAAGSMMF
ncbi:MAG: histidine phosphatase family protein [Acidobacteriota bacterium]|nr:MAG: histidine phosphatase family protein [Acidobacteriota bacterium]